MLAQNWESWDGRYLDPLLPERLWSSIRWIEDLEQYLCCYSSVTPAAAVPERRCNVNRERIITTFVAADPNCVDVNIAGPVDGAEVQ